jgi:hypothetical protein
MFLSTANITSLTAACLAEIGTHRTYAPNDAYLSGLLALGPTIPERDILVQCCRNIDTRLITTNGIDCMRTAECPVVECSARDPAWDCVARMRNVWAVDGLFECVPGQTMSSESVGKDFGWKGWMMVVMLVTVAGVNGI